MGDELIPVAPTESLAQILMRVSQMPDLDLTQIARLLDLKDRWEQREAAKAFARAMVEFKRDPPVLHKNKHVGFGNTRFEHATHDEVTMKLSPALAKYGISHSWTLEQGNGVISVTCTLLHTDGHAQSVTMSGPYDTSGSKNPIQAIGSAKTYLERLTLLAATGMSTSGLPDADDAEKPKPVVPEETFAALKAAADQGMLKLRAAWGRLDEKLRTTITEHYPDVWLQLKEKASAQRGAPVES